MVNILAYEDKNGEVVHVNAIELLTKEGREWLKDRLKGKGKEKKEVKNDKNPE